MTIAKRMLDAFEGSEAGYLVTVVGDKGKKGKAEAKYKTVPGQVTEELETRARRGPEREREEKRTRGAARSHVGVTRAAEERRRLGRARAAERRARPK